MNRFTRFILLTLPLIPSLGFAHPLQKALEGLSKVAGEIKTVKAADPSVTTKALSEQIDKAWLTALFLPMEVASERSDKLGINVKEDEAQPGLYRRKSNENFKALKAAAYSFDSRDWLVLRDTTQEQIHWIEKFNLLLNQTTVTQNISGVAVTRAQIGADDTRVMVLKDLLEMSEKTLQCIERAANFFNAVGVRVVGPDSSLQWSVEDLRSKYGVSSIAELHGSQKQEFVKKIDELRKSSSHENALCIPRTHLSFLIKENSQLKGSQL